MKLNTEIKCDADGSTRPLEQDANAAPKFEIDPRYRWREFVKRAGGHEASADDGYTVLTKLYGEAGRAYHTMAHISWCIDLLHEFFPERQPRPPWFDRVEFALWLHDVIYDPKRKDNEKRSAHVLIGAAALLGLDPKLAHEASFDVECTTHTIVWTHPPRPVPTQWVLDIDLASLGFDPERFAKNSARNQGGVLVGTGGTVPYWSRERSPRVS